MTISGFYRLGQVERDKIVKLAISGLDVETIATRFGVTSSAVRQLVARTARRAREADTLRETRQRGVEE